MTASDYIEVNGERIPVTEAGNLVRMLCNDAKQIAGVFHGMNRSTKFRKNWPNEYTFADCNWKSFLDAARKRYTARLADPKTSPADARRIHLALVIHAMAEKGSQKDPRLQVAPNTQQFEGDRFENRKIIEQFGKQSNTFKELMLGTATFY